MNARSRLVQTVLVVGAVVALGVAATGCSSGSKTASPPTSKPSSSSSSTSTSTKPGSKGPKVGAVRLAGFWESHGVGLVIDRKGQGRLVWRTYRDCGTDPPPCDTMKGNKILDGGHATLKLVSVRTLRSTGRILTTSDPKSVPVGPANARLDLAHHELYLSPSPAAQHRFCNPKSPEGACGA